MAGADEFGEHLRKFCAEVSLDLMQPGCRAGLAAIAEYFRIDGQVNSCLSVMSEPLRRSRSAIVFLEAPARRMSLALDVSFWHRRDEAEEVSEGVGEEDFGVRVVDAKRVLTANYSVIVARFWPMLRKYSSNDSCGPS